MGDARSKTRRRRTRRRQTAASRQWNVASYSVWLIVGLWAIFCSAHSARLSRSTGGSQGSAVAVKTTYIYFTAPYHPISKPSPTPKHFINCGCVLPSSSTAAAPSLVSVLHVHVRSAQSMLTALLGAHWSEVLESAAQPLLDTVLLSILCSQVQESPAQQQRQQSSEIQKPGGGYGL